jgi:hypothetical protein
MLRWLHSQTPGDPSADLETKTNSFVPSIIPAALPNKEMITFVISTKRLNYELL